MKPLDLLVAFPLLLSCRSTDDPLYGVRAAPDRAPADWSAPAPNGQVIVVTEGHEAPLQDKPPAPPGDPAPPAPESRPPPPADPLAEERARNETAFDQDYLRLKERLFADHAGRWIAIAGGRLLPADERGRPAPAATLEDCLKATDTAAPAALHRFVFRLGEEGDVVYADLGSKPRGLVGSALKAALGIATAFDIGNGEITWTREGKSRPFRLENDRIELTLADVTGRQTMGVRLTDSTAFTGFLVLEPDAAGLLDTARFEIPGQLLLRASGGFEELRRTRVRVRVPELELDAIVPAAAWPRVTTSRAP